MKKIFLVLLAVVSLVACDKGGEDTPPKTITIPNQQQLTQTVYADDNAGKSGVTFKTTGAWTSEIAESATAKSTRTATDWISISPSSGDKAGDYTISISLETNYTGEKRSAIISLKCSGEMIDVVVTQEALTAAGDKPTPAPLPSGSGELKNETTEQSVKLVAMKHDIESPDRVRIKFVEEGGNGDEYLADFYNPLKDGKLRSGVYNIKLRNTNPQPEMIDGDCEWYKSFLGDYGTSGTIKVELNNDTYTFTFDILIGESTKLTGSFTGIPEYLNKEVKVESITLNETSKIIEVGDNFMLTATILPENATNKRYTWSSSNPTIATVDEDGRVAAIKAGSSIITVTTEDGNKNAQCAVTAKAREVTGSGTFTYKFDDNSQTSTFSPTYVEDYNGIRFKDNNDNEVIYFNYHTFSRTLEAGIYEWEAGSTSSRKWHSQKGDFGKMIFYCEGAENPGTITVAKSGDIYTITLNWNVSEFGGDGGGRKGKITGTYIGKIVSTQ